MKFMKLKDFLLEADKIGDSPLQDHIKAQDNFDQKISELTSKLKKAIDDKRSDPKEVNKMKQKRKVVLSIVGFSCKSMKSRLKSVNNY